MGNLFKRIDQFGQGVGIKIKGEDVYTTTIGGITTLCVLTVTTAYFAYLLSIMADYGDTSITFVVANNYFEN